MRIKKVTKESVQNKYDEIDRFIKETTFEKQIENGLESIFLISQNLPVTSLSDFLSGESFSLTESYEELEISYELIKLGFYKQAMISLRTGLDIGLLSIFWSIMGKDDPKFREWMASNLNTPFKNKKFWNKLKTNRSIDLFEQKFALFDEIKSFDLSDYVHTKGSYYSNHGSLKRVLKGKNTIETFKEWFYNFIKIVEILETLHLLKFPTLNIRYKTEYLINKFGSTDKIPQCGIGLGDEMNIVGHLISDKKRRFIEKLANQTEEVKYIQNWIESLPDLSPSEVYKVMLESHKLNIRMSGYKNWAKSYPKHDNRITKTMSKELKVWARDNGLMNLDQVLKK